MTRPLVAYTLAALAGALLTWWGLSTHPEALSRFRAVQEAHTLAVAKGADYRAESERLAAVAATEHAAAESLRAQRPVARAAVLASPDAAARELGLTLTAPDSLTRCISLGELAGLMADRAELELADSAAGRDAQAFTACLVALSYSDSAEAVARADALRLYEAAGELAGEVAAMRRTRWLWAAGGAAVAILAVLVAP